MHLCHDGFTLTTSHLPPAVLRAMLKCEQRRTLARCRCERAQIRHVVPVSHDP